MHTIDHDTSLKPPSDVKRGGCDAGSFCLWGYIKPGPLPGLHTGIVETNV